jgi:hypothetical protein
MHSIIFCLIFFISAVGLPQNSGKDSNSAKDSISTFRGLNLEINIPYKNEFRSFQSGYLFNNAISDLNIDSTSIWIATKTFFNQPVFYGFSSSNLSGDMLKPLRVQYESEQKLSTLRYILGMAQTGAVGYLLYKHIKKFGFK